MDEPRFAFVLAQIQIYCNIFDLLLLHINASFLNELSGPLFIALHDEEVKHQLIHELLGNLYLIKLILPVQDGLLIRVLHLFFLVG